MTSPTLKQLLSTKQGFRNNNWSPYQNFDLHDLIYHEIGYLRNNDILYYLNEHYQANIDFHFPHIHEQGKKEGWTKEEIEEEEAEAFCENSPVFVDEVHTFLTNRFQTHDLYGIWLTSEEAVRYYYSSPHLVVSSFEIPNDALVISDLDEEGILIVTKTNPMLHLQDSK